MSYNLIVTPTFDRAAKPLLKKFKTLKTDLVKLFTSLQEDPKQGKSLGKDCYKLRMAITAKGKGKSGGARIITYVKVVVQKIFLLTIYDKSQKEDISYKELNELLKYVQ
ncbi:MAG: hypothetical protein FVQ77_12125 [Cytophagales bacterium]|nr:hypothetical protein [Cytophagales bacterium]